MKIEDHWKDSFIYCVQFLTAEQIERKITKFIVLPKKYSSQEIELMVGTKFKNVKKTLFIDELGDGLLLKELERYDGTFDG
ncbi:MULTISPECIES: hypothetical protein [Carnobacterium]|uniref:Uncharacterized protein n=1 Tax=Carnobacterium divergens TaxID=2748 RepID=A0A5F0MEX4_CARDV|nr:MULTISPECIES: hypothetical protein [Carnobacterium]MDT1940332.1 hypothetical protein [Carnobacterium divergens]MDT1942770.1 hypothetical protein [Carnobacterium divergens]MDT1948576.1 hypothetical protein [Carnobacterium divergens]MDT1951057.1 hypothetical protein [Carnobacterium divergens]MDT1956115.1 hypothetical protein [Carnobacterium divergens]